MRTCSLYRRAHERACSQYRRACHTHRRALMRACPTYSHTSEACLNSLPTRTHARLFRVQAHLPLSRPRMWAHPLPKNPLKIPYDPPYLPCPKNLKPITMQDVQTTNLNLAHRETDASCSRNHSISYGSSLELTVATGTNEVAMWALQLYIGFFSKLPLTIPGAHGVHFSNHLQPQNQRPATYIMAVPRPLFILSPQGPFFAHHGQVRTCIVTFI
jgi:hypothetical protein